MLCTELQTEISTQFCGLLDSILYEIRSLQVLIQEHNKRTNWDLVFKLKMSLVSTRMLFFFF